MSVLKLASAAAGLLSGVIFSVLATTALTAHAQIYPVKPIRLILPYLGGTDPIARWLALGLSTAVGKQVVVDPRIGAGGNIGHVAFAKSPPDGYTLMLGAPPVVVNPILDPKVEFDWHQVRITGARMVRTLSCTPSCTKLHAEFIRAVRQKIHS